MLSWETAATWIQTQWGREGEGALGDGSLEGLHRRGPRAGNRPSEPHLAGSSLPQTKQVKKQAGQAAAVLQSMSHEFICPNV